MKTRIVEWLMVVGFLSVVGLAFYPALQAEIMKGADGQPIGAVRIYQCPNRECDGTAKVTNPADGYDAEYYCATCGRMFRLVDVDSQFK